MERFKWLMWGLLFSVILFLAIYFLLYTKMSSAQEIPTLMLGNKDISGMGIFFSKITNVILASLVIGLSLGILTGIGSKKKETPIN